VKGDIDDMVEFLCKRAAYEEWEQERRGALVEERRRLTREYDRLPPHLKDSEDTILGDRE
jgi:hypothetical protein